MIEHVKFEIIPLRVRAVAAVADPDDHQWAIVVGVVSVDLPVLSAAP
jgi:hypothetical protein